MAKRKTTTSTSAAHEAEKLPNLFEAAYAKWLETRALAYQVWPDSKQGEAGLIRAMNAQQEAEWQFIRTPAETIQDIRTRAMVVQTVMTDVEDAGEPTDNRHRIILSVLVSEIVSYMPK